MSHFLKRSAIAMTAILLLAGLSCGTQDDPNAPSERLCGGEAGVGLEITGRAEPVEFCVSASAVSAVLSGAQYDVTATASRGGVIYELQMVFTERNDWPVELLVTDDLSEASINPGTVWLFYQEVPQGGQAIESQTAAGGTFTLSFSDGAIVVGTMADIDFGMVNAGTSDAAGTRSLAEGFFSLEADVQ